jgi:hypothetical protein
VGILEDDGNELALDDTELIGGCGGVEDDRVKAA